VPGKRLRARPKEAEQKRKAEADRKKAEAPGKPQRPRRPPKRRGKSRPGQTVNAARPRRREAREDQMRRIMGQAGATGAPDARGTAERSSGPSAGYAARVAARIRPNIVYTEEFPARLATEIEVRAAPDGTILSRRVVRGSGNSAWDAAALRAIDRTGSLPRDTDGRVPSPLIVEMRPLD
jgi:colicin import membrane protein